MLDTMAVIIYVGWGPFENLTKRIILGSFLWFSQLICTEWDIITCTKMPTDVETLMEMGFSENGS